MNSVRGNVISSRMSDEGQKFFRVSESVQNHQREHKTSYPDAFTSIRADPIPSRPFQPMSISYDNSFGNRRDRGHFALNEENTVNS